MPIARCTPIARTDEVVRRRPNTDSRPHTRPRLMTGTTQRPEGETNPSPRPFGCPHPRSPKCGLQNNRTFASTPGHPARDAHARDLRPTAGLLTRGSSPAVAFPGCQSQWTMTEDSPLTVAGAAAALSKKAPAPRSLLIPKGNRREQNRQEVSRPAIACALLCSRRNRIPSRCG